MAVGYGDDGEVRTKVRERGGHYDTMWGLIRFGDYGREKRRKKRITDLHRASAILAEMVQNDFPFSLGILRGKSGGRGKGGDCDLRVKCKKTTRSNKIKKKGRHCERDRQCIRRGL